MIILVKRALLVFPFAVAAVLNILAILARPLGWPSHRIEIYLFLFGTPWSWLLDRGWFDGIHNKRLEIALAYAVILWIPALLYSICLWLLMKMVKARI